MHFSANASDINAGMSLVGHALSARPTRAIFEGVLIETVDDGICLTCTDGEMIIRTRVNAMVVDEGVAIMPAKLFGELIRKLSGEVDVEIDKKFRAEVRALGSNTSIQGTDASEFPDVPDVRGEFQISLPQNRLRDAVSRIMFAISTDETRRILTGCLMEVSPTEARFVGLDGFRLALQRIQAENQLPATAAKGVVSAVVPGRIMGEVGKMLPDSEDAAQITFNSSHIMFSFGPVRVYATLLTGEFIDYQKILPTAWTTEAMVMRSLFSDAIDRCSLMAREGKNNLIYLHLLPDGRMEMTANADRGDVHEEMDIGFEGNELSIAFNSRYLTDIIHNIDGERLCMCFNSNVSPCMIKPVEGNAFTFLVLPVRIFGK